VDSAWVLFGLIRVCVLL